MDAPDPRVHASNGSDARSERGLRRAGFEVGPGPTRPYLERQREMPAPGDLVQ